MSRSDIAGPAAAPHFGLMSAYEFEVEQRPVPGTHEHGWVAIDRASGTAIDLPLGGSGAWLGRYPEIAAWLGGQGVKAALEFSRARGDIFDADHDKGVYSWTFNTAGGIVVRDIPRLLAGIKIQT